MYSWYKYLIVSLVFSRLGFWSGNLFLIAPFPDRCLLVPSLMAASQILALNCRLQLEQVIVMESAGGSLVLALRSLCFLSASQIIVFHKQLLRC